MKAIVGTALPPIISVVGRSRVGKTTFIVKLVRELTARGYRVGVIKHSIHHFEVAPSAKDTWKHVQAGAVAVAFASAHELVVARRLDREMDLDLVAGLMGDVDLIITEGYKQAHKPKIEVWRRALGSEPISAPDELIAIIGDCPPASAWPCFVSDDVAGVATLIEERFLGKKGRS